MKGFKRFTAIALSAAMIIGSCFTVMADTTGSREGEEGKLEGYVEKNIFSVNVPTNDAESLKMIVDPQGLIEETNAAAYAGIPASAFESGATVFFKRSVLRGGESASMNHASDTISSANIGRVSANVTYTAEVTGADGITFVSTNEALSGNTPSMRIFFTDENTVEADENLMLDNSKVTGTVSTSVNALDKSWFSASYNGATYTYGLTEATSSNAISNAAKAAFHFVAAANPDADWSSVKTMKPKLTLTWKFEEKKDGGAAEEERIMVANGTGGYRYDFSPAVAGTLTSMTIDGTLRDGVITNGNASYGVAAEGRFVIGATAVTNLSLGTGNHTVVAVIGGKSYTFKIKN